MSDDATSKPPDSFLGTGWGFPPEFVLGAAPGQGRVTMTSDEEDIACSLRILFGTALGERFLRPKYGLDMQELLFEAVNTTTKTYLEDRIRTSIAIHEPRIKLISLALDDSGLNGGYLGITLEYEVRATNSRYNLVYPFYDQDGNEASLGLGSGLV